MNWEMDVSKNRGTPEWMVYNGKPYFLMDDLGVFPYFWKHPNSQIAGPSRFFFKFGPSYLTGDDCRMAVSFLTQAGDETHAHIALVKIRCLATHLFC